MNPKRYLLRDEPFGYTLYDRTTLRHEFVLRDELEGMLITKGLDKENYDYLPAKRSDYRNDIIYSPIRVYYETTLACNLRCKYCFNDSGRPRPDELTKEEIINSLHALKQANVIDIRFSGGELTRMPDWFEILKTAKDLNFAVSCNTNGVYIESEVPEKFAELNLEQVTVSIDGRREHHEMHRGKRTFVKTINSLRRMHDLGVKLRLNTLITKASLNDIDYMVELASQYTTEINFFITRFVGRGVNLRIEDAVTFEEFYEMSQRAAKVRDKYSNLSILHFEEATIYNSSRSGIYDRFGLKVGPPDGSTRFNITSDGGLWAGGYIPYVDSSYCMGNIRTDDIYEVWQRSNKLESFREESKRLEEYCSQCNEIGKRCPGPNFELELYRKRNPKAQNPYCFYGNGPSLLTIIEENLGKQNVAPKPHYPHLEASLLRVSNRRIG